MNIGLAFDLLLALLITTVAAASMVSRALLTSVVLFIVYGVLAAIAWVRLGAVDVALAEAAIGAGLTGLLLIGALGRLQPLTRACAAGPSRPKHSLLATIGLAAGCAALSLALCWLVLSVEPAGTGLRSVVASQLDQSGVTNPVTAVLVNFRGYDTLVETVVLLVALIGVWSLTPDGVWGGRPGPTQQAAPDGVLAYFGRLLPAVGVLVGIHLLWAGSTAPGGAFQAGTVMAAVWLVAALAALTDAPAITSAALRAALIAGPALFLLLGTVGALAGTFLVFPVAVAKAMILFVESAIVVSVAATLAMLVLGAPRRLP